jgi:actin related protein 2/3 complex subunit 4
MAQQGNQRAIPYYNAVRSTLTASMCLQNFASQEVERHNKPEIEARYHIFSLIFSIHLHFSASPETILNSVIIARSSQEKIFIETSVNSIRVSVSLKKIDELDSILSDRFLRFLTQRAENFIILRRKPVQVWNLILNLRVILNYNISF